MSERRDQFTLYYRTTSPLSTDETTSEERFDDITSAVSRAFQVLQGGGSPTHLIVDDAVIFSSDDLRDMLKYISATVDLRGPAAIELACKALTEMLIKQLVKTVKFAHEHFGAVAVYGSMLDDMYKAADEAIQKNDLGLLYKITGKMAFWHTPGESDVKRWGKDFLQAYRRDAGWLGDTKAALTKIEAAAKKLDVVGPQNEELKTRIIKQAEDGLITHI